MGIRRGFGSLLLVWWMCAALDAQAAAPDKPPAQLLGVRVVKQQLGLLGKTPRIEFPGHESQCRLTGYQGENSQEFYFDVEVRGVAPTSCQVRVACDGLAVRTVWVGQTKVAFDAQEQAAVFALVADTRNAYALHLNLWDSPELLLYYMPKPSARASGRYRDVPWPAAAVAAEANLMFAARAAFQEMQLGTAAKGPTGFDGHVAVGGFETNYPRVGQGPGGHEDFPPHLHLFLVVPPGWRIRQASHLYLDDAGRLTGQVHCSPSGLNDRPHNYQRDEWCPQRDLADRVAFEFKIDADGCLVIRRPGSEFRLRPAEASGSFRTGCKIEKAGRPWCRLTATDDTKQGLLRIVREFEGCTAGPGLDEETIRYNSETGALLEHVRP